MPRRYVAVFGLAIAVVFGAFTVAFATDDPVRPFALAPALATALAGALLFAAGLIDDVEVGSRRLRWFHLAGAAIVLHALATVVFGAQSAVASGTSLVSPNVIVSATLALIFLWIGVDFLRGGVHHNLAAFE